MKPLAVRDSTEIVRYALVFVLDTHFRRKREYGIFCWSFRCTGFPVTNCAFLN